MRVFAGVPAPLRERLARALGVALPPATAVTPAVVNAAVQQTAAELGLPAAAVRRAVSRVHDLLRATGVTSEQLREMLEGPSAAAPASGATRQEWP